MSGAPPGLRVSIIVPVLNEEATIVALLDAIRRQTYPSHLMEVILADGGSRDRTIEHLRREAERHPSPRLTVVENPAGSIPAGLNRAVAHATGDLIVRLDAHSEPAPDYVERCVEGLVSGRGDNVGGCWEIRPLRPGAMPQAIAFAAAHPLGAGDARYRTGGRAGCVDTVPYGAFSRWTLDAVGPFDERLQANEDYDWNARLRAAGGLVWFDPRIRCVYRPRDNLRALARQYFRYGFWKVRMLRRQPRTLRWRQAAPPAMLLTVALLGAIAPHRRPARHALACLLALYGGALMTAAHAADRATGNRAVAALVPLALTTMHGMWAAGFLWSAGREGLIARAGRRRPRRAPPRSST